MADPSTPTEQLIYANRADQMRVATRDGDALGHVQTFMIHKRSGRVTHAVLSLGGFLGLGNSFYPLPFSLLTYDPAADRYVVTTDRRLLEGGPSWASNPPAFDQAYADRVASYYGVTPDNLDLG